MKFEIRRKQAVIAAGKSMTCNLQVKIVEANFSRLVVLVGEFVIIGVPHSKGYSYTQLGNRPFTSGEIESDLDYDGIVEVGGYTKVGEDLGCFFVFEMKERFPVDSALTNALQKALKNGRCEKE